MPFDAEAEAGRVERDLRAVASPDRAEHERAYLKSQLIHLGASVPAVRTVAKDVRARHPDLDHDGVVALVEALWSVGIHERRMAAVELLDLYAGVLGPGDIALVERLIREARTWALVDGLAATVAGSLVERYPQLAGTLDRWVADGDFWVRRAAVLALLVPLRRGEGDPDRFLGYADRLLDDTEFFVRKALGWVLRDMSRRRPQRVRDWLAPRTARASGVTLREAVKHLEPADRQRLLSAHRRHQPAG